MVIGYGPARLITPLADEIREQAPVSGLNLPDVLRVEDDRYWSCLCNQPDCCPPEGKPLSTLPVSLCP